MSSDCGRAGGGARPGWKGRGVAWTGAAGAITEDQTWGRQGGRRAGTALRAWPNSWSPGYGGLV